MIEVIVGILLLIVGVIFVLMNKKATPVGQSKGESSPSKATEKDEAKDKA